MAKLVAKSGALAGGEFTLVKRGKVEASGARLLPKKSGIRIVVDGVEILAPVTTNKAWSGRADEGYMDYFWIDRPDLADGKPCAVYVTLPPGVRASSLVGSEWTYSADGKGGKLPDRKAVLTESAAKTEAGRVKAFSATWAEKYGAAAKPAEAAPEAPVAEPEAATVTEAPAETPAPKRKRK